MLLKPLQTCSASLPPSLCPLLNPSLTSAPRRSSIITGWAAFRHARAFHVVAKPAETGRAAPLTLEQERAYLAGLRRRSAQSKPRQHPSPTKPRLLDPTFASVSPRHHYRTAESPVIDDLDAPESQVQLEDDLAHDVGASAANTATSLSSPKLDLAAVQDLIDQSFRDNRPRKLDASSLSRYDWRLRSTSRLSAGERSRLERAGLLKRKYRKQPRFKRLMRGDAWFPEVSAYTDRFFNLMQSEQEAEIAALKLRLEKPTQQLVADGYALDELCGRWEEKFEYGKPVATFFRSRNRYMRWNRLEPGATVIISKTSFDVDAVKRKDAFPGQPKGDELLTGSVLRKNDRAVSIAFEGKFEELESHNQQWR